MQLAINTVSITLDFPELPKFKTRIIMQNGEFYVNLTIYANLFQFFYANLEYGEVPKTVS